MAKFSTTQEKCKCIHGYVNSIRVFHKLDENVNNGNFHLCCNENKKSSDKMCPQWRIEPGPLSNQSMIQLGPTGAPYRATEAIACKAKT